MGQTRTTTFAAFVLAIIVTVTLVSVVGTATDANSQHGPQITQAPESPGGEQRSSVEASQSSTYIPTWRSLCSELRSGSTILALIEFRGDLIVGGYLYPMSGADASYIARWDGSNWHALGEVINAGVYDLLEFNDDLIAIGPFHSYSSEPRFDRVARWDGLSWSGFGDDPLFINYPSAAVEYNNELIVGGWSGPYVKRWTGSSWELVGDRFGAVQPSYSIIRALAVYDGELIAAGRFDSAGGTAALNIARWTGTQWEPLGSGLQVTDPNEPDTGVSCLTVYPSMHQDGELIAGGGFTESGGQPLNHIARWNGTRWASLGSGTDSSVRALTEYGGDLVAGGRFSTAGGSTANRIARWDGSNWAAFGSGFNGSINTLGNYEDRLIAAGHFDSAGVKPIDRIAGWRVAYPSWAPPCHENISYHCNPTGYPWRIPDAATGRRTMLGQGFPVQGCLIAEWIVPCTVRTVRIAFESWGSAGSPADVRVSIRDDDGSGLPGALERASVVIPHGDVTAAMDAGKWLNVSFAGPAMEYEYPGEYHVVIDVPGSSTGIWVYGDSGVVVPECNDGCPPNLDNTHGEVYDASSGTWERAVDVSDAPYSFFVEVNYKCPIELTGDADGGGNYGSSDIIYLVNYIFKGGAPPEPCELAGDADWGVPSNDCAAGPGAQQITVGDIIFLVNYIFKGGPPPCDACSLLDIIDNASLCP